MSADAPAGTEVAGYRIDHLLGRGGMSVVYLAEHLRLGRKVALKLLAPELAHDERFRERFLRESKLAASIDHPNVIPIYDADDADGVLYIAMRYVEGIDLRKLLAEEGKLDPRRALSIVAQVAAALDAAHARGLVHRDVKPGNILLAGGEHVYLSDFGLTKQASSQSGLTQTGQLVGTLDYVAPEQIQGQVVDGRTDVYSLACVLYECLAGGKPYARDTEVAVLWSHMHDPPPTTGDAAVDAVIAKAMAKDPGARYATAGELAADARRAAGISTQEVVAPALRRRRLDRRLLAVGGVLAAAAVAAALVLGTRGGGGASLVPVAPNSVAAIDPSTNRVVDAISVGAGPLSVSGSSRGLAVVNRQDRTLSLVDPKTKSVRSFATGSAGPVEVTSGGGAIWVANDGEGTVTRIAGSFVETIRIGPRYRASTSLTTPSSPIVVAPGSVWALSDANPTALVRIDPATSRVAGRVPGFSASTDVVAAFGALWIADGPSGTVDRLDLATRSVAATIPVTGGPFALAVGEDAIWAVVPGFGKVWRIEPGTNAVSGSIDTGADSTGIAAGAGAVWVMHSRDGTVSRIDPQTREVVATIPVGNHLGGIVVFGGKVWVTVGEADAYIGLELSTEAVSP